jgi:nucleotide-binding universal stress UspA family protein
LKKVVSNILVAVDGSNNSFRAADAAMKLAGDYGAKLFVVTVTHIPEKYHVSQLEVLESEERRAEMDDAKKWYEEYIQRAKQNGIVLWTELLNSHRPVDYELLEYAEAKKTNLIVIGTRGRNKLARLLIGSVAYRVVTYSYCPVLLVK